MEHDDVSQSDLAAAEEQLRLGRLEEAAQAAHTALQKTNDPSGLGRGYSVIIQSDFQLNRLTNLEQALLRCGHQLQQLPVQVVLLWGVVAVELQEADAARATLGKYLAAMRDTPSGMTREDAMAISRLYAVQLLAKLCEDFLAAATWLEAGGAGLSHEQQELLLLEVEEVEELLQEQHLAEWASTHAAAATDGSPEHHPGTDVFDTPASVDAHSIAPCTAASPVSLASSAAGVVHINGVSPFVESGSAMGSLDLGPSASGISWESADQQHLQQQVMPQQQTQQQQQQQQPQGCQQQQQLQQVAVQGQLNAAVTPLQQQQQEQQQQPSSPVPALVQQQQQQHSTEATMQQQAEAIAEVVTVEQQGLNPFCTITGLLESFDEADEPSSTIAAVQQQQQQAPLTAGVTTTTAAVTIETGRSLDSASTSLPDGRDQIGSSSSSISKASSSKAAGNSSNAGSTAGVTAVQAGQPAAAAAGGSAAAARAEQQSWAAWVSSSGSRLWSSAAVQGALHSLNMQDLEPYEVVGGAALAGLIGYSVYRERKALRRAAASLAAGVAQTAQMALGLSVVNPMAAVPQTQYL